MIAQILKSFLFFLALSSLAANADSTENPDVWKSYEKTKKSLPKDASKTLEQAVNCNHLSGEINGDRSQHDKETIRTMNKLDCGKVENNVLLIKARYKKNIGVQEAFKTYYETE